MDSLGLDKHPRMHNHIKPCVDALQKQQRITLIQEQESETIMDTDSTKQVKIRKK